MPTINSLACTTIVLVSLLIFLFDKAAEYLDDLFLIKPVLIATNFEESKNLNDYF